jgi:hypothetical protein
MHRIAERTARHRGEKSLSLAYEGLQVEAGRQQERLLYRPVSLLPASRSHTDGHRRYNQGMGLIGHELEKLALFVGSFVRSMNI